MDKKSTMTNKVVDRPLYTVAREEVLTKITIPMYMKNHIDSAIDLTAKDSCLCPFHEENTPSFRYNRGENYWRCFGKCKNGGTVIELHMFKEGITDHFIALAHLRKKFSSTYGLTSEPFIFDVNESFKSVEDILKPKEDVSSLSSFMNSDRERPLGELVPLIEIQLSVLKTKDLSLYIKACMEFDSLYCSSKLNADIAKEFLEKIRKVNKHVKVSNRG